MEKENKPKVEEDGFNGFDNDILDPDDFEDEHHEGDGKGDGEGKPGEGGDDPNKKPKEGEGKEGDAEGDGKNPEAKPGENDPDNPGESEEEKVKKEKEKNAYYAQLRRKKEAEERAAKAERAKRDKLIRDQATVEGKLSVLKENPYTKKPVVDVDDLETYEIMRELDEQGKDPIEDFAEEVSKRKREARKKADDEAKAKKEADEKMQAQAKEEVNAFKKAHPDVDLAKLSDDPDFIEAGKNLFGKVPLDTIYEIYEARKAKKGKKSDGDDDEQSNGDEGDDIAKKITKTPKPGAGAGKKEKSVLDMTDEEFKEHEEQSKKDSGDFF